MTYSTRLFSTIQKRCFVRIMYSNKATITNSNNVSYFSTDTESREQNNLAIITTLALLMVFECFYYKLYLLEKGHFLDFKCIKAAAASALS